MRTLARFIRGLAAMGGALAYCCAFLSAQSTTDSNGKVVEVYLHSSESVTLPGVTQITIFDPEIASAELEGPNAVRIAGLERGETVAIATIDGKIVSLVVEVIPRPGPKAPPSFEGDLERGYGYFASDAQISRSEGRTDLTLLQSLTFMQKNADHQFDAALFIEDQTQPGQNLFNPRNAWINYYTPRVEISFLDFSQNLTGQLQQNRFPNYSVSNFVQLRGARVTLVRGHDRYTIFGGTTLPTYFLTLAGTRDIAGFAFRRQQTDTFSWTATSSVVDVPPQDLSGKRIASVMQLAGFTYVPGTRWNFDGSAGLSNHGTLLRGNAGYWAPGWSVFGSFLQSSPEFPLNQIQSLFAGTTSLRGGAAFGTNSRLGEDVYYEHTITNSGVLSIPRAVSDYLSPAFRFRFSPGETANFSYTYSRNTGGFTTGTETGNRFDIALNSRLPHSLGNTAHFRLGSVQDPLGLQSQHELQFDDSFSVPVRIGTLFLGYTYNRLDPSLIQKLNQELGLLSPQLAQLFAANPTGFIATTDLPPEIRALVESQIPVSATATASLQMHVGRRLTVAPSLAFTHSTSGPERETWTHFLGYSLTYQLSKSWMLRSSLSTVWTTNSMQAVPERSTILAFGVQKNFNGSPIPEWMFRGSNTISGRVFRDANFNGLYNSGETGFEGIQVQLDNGAIQRTDKNGQFRFTGVHGDLHRVSIDAAQFPTAVRMTTPAEIAVSLTGHHDGFADFGVVDFARLVGNVFNDLRFEGKRQPDSVPIADVQLLLTKNGKVVRTIITSAGGTFELDNLEPGDYELEVDLATVPANYIVSPNTFPVHLEPVRTTTIDIPLRAMRSVSGHVYLRATLDSARGSTDQKDSAARLVPLVGVQLTAGQATVKTDSEGAFVLRNLPAGDLTVRLISLKSPPSGVAIPSGPIHMPAEPISVQGASIVIMNAELVPFLVDLTDQPRDFIAAPTR